MRRQVVRGALRARPRCSWCSRQAPGLARLGGHLENLENKSQVTFRTSLIIYYGTCWWWWSVYSSAQESSWEATKRDLVHTVGVCPSVCSSFYIFSVVHIHTHLDNTKCVRGIYWQTRHTGLCYWPVSNEGLFYSFEKRPMMNGLLSNR